jgi:hypothetical protein
MLYIDTCTQSLQAKYLARFYLGYLNRDITWEVFQEIAQANQRMFIGDYSLLEFLATKNRMETVNDNDESSIGRLVALGLVLDTRLKSLSGSVRVTEDYENLGVVLSEFGKAFCKYLDRVDDVRARELDALFAESKYISPKAKEMSEKDRINEIARKANEWTHKKDD